MRTDDHITAVLALRRAQRVVVFTGAGVSTESGVPTFRDADGFWQRFPPETFATWTGLLRTALTDPRRVAEFVLNVIDPIAQAVPNPAHAAIARLGDHVNTVVVTQNIDGLHQSAGSDHVLEIHGSLLEVIDVSDGRIVRRFSRDDLLGIADRLRQYIGKRASLLSLAWTLRQEYRVDWRGRHRPNLVLFGDALAQPAWSQARTAVEACDLLITVGTSGTVYPAAMLPEWAELNGTTVVTIDPQAGHGCWLQGPAGVVLPGLVNDAFGPG